VTIHYAFLFAFACGHPDRIVPPAYDNLLCAPKWLLKAWRMQVDPDLSGAAWERAWENRFARLTAWGRKHFSGVKGTRVPVVWTSHTERRWISVHRQKSRRRAQCVHRYRRFGSRAYPWHDRGYAAQRFDLGSW